jgi:hypothetical protein
MPAQGAIYIRDISGHTAQVDSSGSLQVTVTAGLTAGTGVSGQPVNVTSGLVALASGAWLASGIVVNISGQSVTTSVSVGALSVSGNVVYTTSGFNLVQMQSGFNAVTVSGFGAMSGVAVSTSGNVHTISSGAISVVSGSVTVNSGAIQLLSGAQVVGGVGVVSGAISITSGAVSVTSGSITINSGTVAVSGLFGGFSGAQKFLSGASAVSGAIPVIPFLYDYSGAQWAPFTTTISGSTGLEVYVSSGIITTSVASGAVSVSSGAISIVSGSVTVNSGTITASVSSGAVSITSGAISIVSGSITVNSGTITLGSGAGAVMSGIAVFQASGAICLISGQTIAQSSGAWMASGIVPNISGQAVSMSGNALLVNQGAPTMASGFGFSGGVVTVNAIYDLSGQNWIPTVSLASGVGAPQGIGITPATKVRIGMSGVAIQSGIPSLSGGVALQSGDLYVLTLRNLSGNAEMYVGGSGAYPYSGVGFPIGGGDAVTLSVSNANLVSVFAVLSVQRIGWIGSQI